VTLRNASERAAAEEKILKETTQMYRAPELIDLYMRDILTEKSLLFLFLFIYLFWLFFFVLLLLL
jgi:hypothetical protein